MNDGVDLVLMWHMHQPDYRVEGDADAPGFALPWTYLHTIKDYVDMAAHLERHAGMRAVVNFVPVLLEQIDDYAAQFASGRFRDRLLHALAQPDLDRLDTRERRWLLDICFRANHDTMLAPYPQYANLHRIHREAIAAGDFATRYLSGSFFSDLLTWYHLVWCGETERRARPLLGRLFAKGCGFDAADRRSLLELIGELVTGVIGRYRALAAAGRIELGTSPHAHPLAPLLLDLCCARQTQPELPLPTAAAYPGGRSRVLAHIDAALGSHAARFGARPSGLWPAEGAVSDDFVRLCAGRGCRWVASSESVLANSVHRQGSDFAAQRPRHLYRPWQLAGVDGTTLFFRDERLSDLIGFEYARWYGSDAARHFVGELEAIAAAAPADERPLVCVILDGENAWEHYPYNGYYFLDHLYAALATHPTIRVTTFAEIVDRSVPRAELAALVAGSWVHGTLSTWIGHPDKNRAWDLLCAAKRSYDLALSGGRLDAAACAQAESRLGRCESSDWFWWFGSSNPAATIAVFDRLFRGNLGQLYRQLGLPAPVSLAEPIAREAGAGGADNGRGGTMLAGRADCGRGRDGAG